MMIRTKTLLTGLLCAGFAASSAHASNPVEVYILAGQSNQQGHGWFEDHTPTNGVDENGTLLKFIQNDPNGDYDYLRTGSAWTVRSDVSIYTTDGARSGGLTTGFGVNSSRIGPELGFGNIVGDGTTNDVLIIKTVWGGKSLAADFISPTAAKKRGRAVGAFYNQMLTEVDNVLSNIGSYVPGYSGQGYQMKGFGWHQGWNDRVNGNFTSEYEENMVDFINDVRFDLQASDLPFVIANTSIGGALLNGNALTLANAQLGPANLTLSADQLGVDNESMYPEFVGNVMGVNTVPFWRDASISPITSGNQGFHWNQNGETMWLIGEGMGNAMTAMSSYVQFERAYLNVDLQSGEIKIINPASNLTDMDLEAYSITSANGSLDTTNWTSITGNYDGTGNNSVDSGNWSVGTGSTGELSELADAGGADGLITIGSEVSLGVGSWIQNLNPDLEATYTATDGTVIDLNIRYTGFANTLGDLNTDGTLDVQDWAQFVQGVLLDMSALSEAQAYQLGDLDGDMDNDIDDFDLFRRAFELANPEEGSFAAMLEEYRSVPEPGTFVLMAAGALGLLSRRRRGRMADSNDKKDRAAPSTRLSVSAKRAVPVAALAAVVFTGGANAQEMFNVNIFSYGRGGASFWDQQAWRDTVLMDPTDTAGAAGYSTTGWENIQAGNRTVSLTGSLGSSATYQMTNQRNSSPFYWTRTRDASTHNDGNATMLDGHSVGTEDPYDQSKFSIFEVRDIPFAVYDVVIYLGINDGQKFDGKGTIDFDGNIQNFTLPTTEPDGTLTQITNPNDPGNYIVYEQVTGSSFSTTVYGEQFTHMGPAGFQIVEVLDPTELTLRINRTTGWTYIVGDNADNLDVNYYQITSAGDSLSAIGWNSLADQDYDGNGPADGSGEGWEEGIGVGSHGLAEAFLLGDSAVTAGQVIDLGQAYDQSVDAQDLSFRYRTGSGQNFDGVVEYFESPVGDMNGDGAVTNGDIAAFVQALTDPAGYASAFPGFDPDELGDFTGDGSLTNGDIAGFVATLTGGGGSVPEPASLAMLGIGGLFLTRRRRAA